MKVQLTSKVHTFRLDSKTYRAGDVFELDPKYFRVDFMNDVTPKKEKEVEKPKSTVTPQLAPVDAGLTDIDDKIKASTGKLRKPKKASK